MHARRSPSRLLGSWAVALPAASPASAHCRQPLGTRTRRIERLAWPSMPLMSVRMWRLCSLLSCAAGQMTPGSQVVAELRAAIAAGEDTFALPAGGIEFPDGAGLSLSLSLSLSLTHSLSLSTGQIF